MFHFTVDKKKNAYQVACADIGVELMEYLKRMYAIMSPSGRKIILTYASNVKQQEDAQGEVI